MADGAGPAIVEAQLPLYVPCTWVVSHAYIHAAVMLAVGIWR